MTTVYDFAMSTVKSVQEPSLSNTAFCDLARQAWAMIRAALDLPAVSPSFVWTSKTGFCIGDCVRADDGTIEIFRERRYVLIGADDDATENLQFLTDMIVAEKPTRFGPLTIPHDAYWAVRLDSPVDTFSLRAATFWDKENGWVTVVDTLFARLQSADQVPHTVSTE